MKVSQLQRVGCTSDLGSNVHITVKTKVIDAIKRKALKGVTLRIAEVTDTDVKKVRAFIAEDVRTLQEAHDKVGWLLVHLIDQKEISEEQALGLLDSGWGYE